MKCPKCGCEQSTKYGKARGKQRYKCAVCGCQFTRETPRARSLDEKWLAMTLLVSGLSMTAVAKALGVSVQSVMRWKNSGQLMSDDVIKAIRVRKVSKTGNAKIIKDNAVDAEDAEDDFKYNDLYVLETRLDSGLRVDIAIRKKAKTITK